MTLNSAVIVRFLLICYVMFGVSYETIADIYISTDTNGVIRLTDKPSDPESKLLIKGPQPTENASKNSDKTKNEHIDIPKKFIITKQTSQKQNKNQEKDNNEKDEKDNKDAEEKNEKRKQDTKDAQESFNKSIVNKMIICKNKRMCEKSYSIAKVYIIQNSDMNIQISDDTIFSTYNPTEDGKIGMSAMKIPDAGESAKIILHASCKIGKDDTMLKYQTYAELTELYHIFCLRKMTKM